MSKLMRIPFIEGLEQAASLEDFAAALESGVKGNVDCVDWPDSYPYRPECSFKAGWSEEGLGILFNVKGLDVRAMALEDNGKVWEDSCCEFFIAHPSDGTYYNFELNCIGTLLAAKRRSRTDCVHFSNNETAQVRRFSSLPHNTIDIEGETAEWSNGMFIPFRLIGIDGKNPPASIRLNIYKCGDMTAHPHFLSWAPVGTEQPDFHRPEYFGEAVLAKD